MTRSRACCWTRSPLTRSHSPWPRPTRSPAGPAGRPAPRPSWPSSVQRYDADRAERAFTAVEPENRMVARTLETRWEARLAELRRPSRRWPKPRKRCRRCPACPSWRNSPPTCPGSGMIRPATRTASACCAPSSPTSPCCRNPTRPGPGSASAGTPAPPTSSASAAPPIPAPPSAARRRAEMVRELGPVTPSAELAGQLNAAGLRTGHGRPFDVKAVQWIRCAYGIPAPNATPTARSASPRRPQAGLQHRRHLLLDQDRAAHHQARAGKPALHRLGRSHRDPPAASASPHLATSTPAPAAPSRGRRPAALLRSLGRQTPLT